MKFFAGLVAMTLAVPGLSHAANISGTYSIRLNEVCQSIENEVFNKTTTSINTIDEGKIVQSVGLITFTPSKAGGLSGTVSAIFTQAKGTLTILGLPGGVGQPGQPAVADMKIGTKSQSGTYSMVAPVGLAPSKLTLTFTGNPANVFTAYFSQLSSAAYTHIDFIDTESNSGTAATCANSGTAQR